MKTFREIAEMHYASEPSNEFDKKYRENRITALEKLLTKQLRIHDVVGRSEQLLALAQYMCEHQNNLDGKTAKDYLQDFLSQ
ncbi:MAG TPA: hypothetical protein VNJ50_08835 [Gelidibacter sp.]|uniref:hypothetical protein n=1 Tax=Gelidibacter sp. TaxID=2018083 RepID=UPI002BF426E2|nr:hypothetical protein [Gelidibacter sp.]HXJ98938.1 hypothetical protein [Gelidibacter sp.]